MTTRYTTSQLLATAKRYADMEGSQFISDTEWLDYLRAGYSDCYDKLVASAQDYYISSTVLVLTSGSSVPLPDDFYKDYGVDAQVGSDWMPLKRFEFGERGRLNQSTHLSYRLLGSTLQLHPEVSPTSACALRIWYIPRLILLELGTEATRTIQNIAYTAVDTGTAGNGISITYTDGATKGSEVVLVTDSAITVQIADGESTVVDVQLALTNSTAAAALITSQIVGAVTSPQSLQAQTFLLGGVDESDVDGLLDFVEYVPTYAAIRAMDKEESDSRPLQVRLSQLSARIQELAVNRDQGAPERISDSTSDPFSEDCPTVTIGSLTSTPVVISGGDWNTLVGKPSGLVSSSVQVNTGSFSGSISFAVSASYAPGSPSLSASYAGFAVSASYAANGGGSSDFNSLSNVPVGLVSSSQQINSGSFTGSFVGNASTATTASYATTALSASYAPGSPTATASYANTVQYSGINNKPVGLVSSSIQINSGSYTGSFVGTLTGAASTATSASFATTASYATLALNVLNGSVSASFATTASAATSLTFTPATASSAQSVQYGNVTAKPTGLVSSSAQVNSGSFTGSFIGTLSGTITSASYAVTASFATTAATSSYVTGSIDFPNGLVVTGSITASVGFTGNGAAITGVISSSYAVTSSYATVALNSLNGSVSSSFATTASAATSITFTPATASTAQSVQYGNVTAKPTLVSSSAQINTGSFLATGSFTGSFIGALTGNASTATSASNALTASYALSGVGTGGDFNTLINKPTLVSSSAQINSGSFTGSFVGTLTGNASTATLVATASFISSSRYTVTANSSASLAQNASYTASFALRMTEAQLLQLSASTDSRLRVYGRAADRNADLSRPFSIEPSASAGLFIDAVFTGSLKTFGATPAVELFNWDAAPANTLYYTLTNLTGSTVPVTCSLVVI